MVNHVSIFEMIVNICLIWAYMGLTWMYNHHLKKDDKNGVAAYG